MVCNTNKPPVFIADRLEDITLIHKLACLVTGGETQLRRKPFILNYSEAISPLRFPEHVMDRLIFFRKRVRVFGIRFKPEGFYHVFGMPASEIHAAFADMEGLSGRNFRE